MMENNESKQLLLLGAPESGKTTFLAATWNAMKNGSDFSLQIDSLPEDRAYLNSISDRWQKGQNQIHTQVSEQSEKINLQIKNNSSQVGVLRIPDLAGEVYISAWTERTWPKELLELATQTDGVLLFLHPDEGGEPVSIAQLNQATQGLATENTNNDASDQAVADNEVVKFDPRKSPRQVIIVDQIQCFMGFPCYRKNLKLSVLVSAWDLVESIGFQASPEEFVRERYPLMAQYLDANFSPRQIRFFGVSAQGCDFSDLSEDELKKLFIQSPLERINIVNAGGRSNDPTLTFSWMF